MPLLSYTLPTIGNPNSTEDPIIRTALSSISTEYNTNIPNILGAWKPLYTVQTSITAAVGANTFQIRYDTVQASGTNNSPPALHFYADPADYAITGYTTQIRLRASVSCNATAPAVNFTFGLYPVTFSGGAGGITLTLGTVISGTTVAINAPSASVNTPQTSSAITFPAAAVIAPGVVTSGTTATNSFSVLIWQIQYRYV